MSAKDKFIASTSPLKKSASTNEVNINLTNLNLREAKSHAGTTIDRKNLDSNQRSQGDQENNFELFCKDCDVESVRRSATRTKDALTNEIYYINEQFLMQKGKNHTLSEIAPTWKKDCRMWLWKNDKNYKKNRSVTEINPPK